MKAWAIKRYGKDAPLLQMDFPLPQIGEKDVMIQVKATGINPVDFRIRNGEIKLFYKFQFPLILGHDVSGIICEIGKKVTKFKVGDEVYSSVDKGRLGTFAEYAAAHEDNVSLKPITITHTESSGIPLVGLVSWQSLFEKGELKPGNRLFIIGAAGGVGTIAIQLAKIFDIHVSCSASTERIDLVKSLGADEVYDYNKENFIKDIPPVDMVLSTQFGQPQRQAFSLLKKGGRLVSIVGPPTFKLQQEMGNSMFLKLLSGLVSIPSHLRAKMQGGSYVFCVIRPDGALLGKIKNFIDQNKIRPVVDRVFPFSQADQALTYSEKSHGRSGKIIISLDPEDASKVKASNK